MALQHGAHEAILGGQTRQPHPRALLQLRLRLVGGVLLWRVVLRRGKPRPAAERAGQDLAPRPAAVLGDLLLALEFRRLLPLRRSSLRQERRQVVLALDHTSCRRQKAIAAGLVEEARVEPLRRVHLGGGYGQDLCRVVDQHQRVRVGVQHVLGGEGLPAHANVAHGTPHEGHGVSLWPLVERHFVQEAVGGDVVGLAHVRSHGTEGRELHDLLGLDVLEDDAVLFRLLLRPRLPRPLHQPHGRLLGANASQVLPSLQLLEHWLSVVGHVDIQFGAGGRVGEGRRPGVAVDCGLHNRAVSLVLHGDVLKDEAVACDHLEHESVVVPERVGHILEGLWARAGGVEHEGLVCLEVVLDALHDLAVAEGACRHDEVLVASQVVAGTRERCAINLDRLHHEQAVALQRVGSLLQVLAIVLDGLKDERLVLAELTWRPLEHGPTAR
mmetsp:Transcript_42756/g.133455  ORF Transcript_42756/g.133455 Transcript_42756/m.133455 type:complete len:441 (+) Transcript_42756:618-1940(+)